MNIYTDATKALKKSEFQTLETYLIPEQKKTSRFHRIHRLHQNLRQTVQKVVQSKTNRKLRFSPDCLYTPFINYGNMLQIG